MLKSSSYFSFSFKLLLIHFRFSDINQRDQTAFSAAKGDSDRTGQPLGGYRKDSRDGQAIFWEVNSITTGNSQRDKWPIKGSHTATTENVI